MKEKVLIPTLTTKVAFLNQLQVIKNIQKDNKKNPKKYNKL